MPIKNPILAAIPMDQRIYVVTAPWVSWEEVLEIVANPVDELNRRLVQPRHYACNPNAPADFAREHDPNWDAPTPSPTECSDAVFLHPIVTLDWVIKEFTGALTSEYSEKVYRLYNKVRPLSAKADVAWIDAYIIGQTPGVSLLSRAAARIKSLFMGERAILSMRLKIENLCEASNGLSYADLIGALTPDELEYLHRNIREYERSDIYRTIPLTVLRGHGVEITDRILMNNHHITVEDIRHIPADPEEHDVFDPAHDHFLMFNHWEYISTNPAINMDIIKANPGLPWDMRAFCSNPSLRLVDMIELLSKGYLPSSCNYRHVAFTKCIAIMRVQRFLRTKALYSMYVRRFAATSRALAPISCGYMRDLVASFL
jgi:hypothetical protein